MYQLHVFIHAKADFEFHRFIALLNILLCLLYRCIRVNFAFYAART